MKIEVLVRWTEFKQIKQDDNDAYVKRLVEGDEANRGMMKAQVFYDYSPMVMDINDIARFNRSNDPNFTTLRMKDGEGYVISYPYKDWIQLYMELTGKTIMCLLPDNWEHTSTEIGGDDIEFGDSLDDEDEFDDI